MNTVIYHDVQIGYDFGNAAIQFGATNLTNEQPQYVSGLNYIKQSYRLTGAQYYLQGSINF